MTRKIFISFLGTNNYVECKYSIDGEASSPVRFIQEALIERLCREWTEEDRILIFCTSRETTGEKGSKEFNWLDNGHERISDESEKIGLEHRLLDLQNRIGLKSTIEQFDIEAGFTEDEIWGIFNTVYSKLQPNDEIYFDVTHALRSIPLFSIVLFNYSKFMKGTQLKSIHYGAFEQLGPAFKVKEMPMEQRIAPVIDLTNIARLQEYNQIASGLKNFGKVKRLKEVIMGGGNAYPDQTIANLCKSISELDEYIATINLREIEKGNFIANFRNILKSVRKRKDIAAPIKNILNELNRETEDFVSQKDYKNIEAAINWTIKHDMLMQAYPLAAEYIIHQISIKFGGKKPKELSNKQFRMFVGAIIGMSEEDFQSPENWKGDVAEHVDVAKEIADDSLIKEIRQLYAPIREARNSLAHGNGTIKYADLQKGIQNIIECLQYLNPNYKEYPSTKYVIANYGIRLGC